MIMNRHGGSRYAPNGRFDHRVSPPKDVEEEEENPPPSHSTHHLDPHDMDSAIVGLREYLDHEKDRRYALNDTVRKHRNDFETDRAKDRADCASEQLYAERDVSSLVDELATARR